MNVCNNPLILNSLERPENIERVKFRPSRSSFGNVSPTKRGTTMLLKSHDKHKRTSFFESLGSEMKSDIYKKTPSRKTTDMKKDKIYIDDDYDDEEDLLIDVIGDDLPNEMILGFEHLIDVDLSDSGSNYS